MTPTPKDILTKARALIARPDGWTWRTQARDKDNVPVPVQSNAACKFCAFGALNRAHLALNAGGVAFDEARQALNNCVDKTRDADFVAFNDRPFRKQEEVVALFDKAIARCP